MPRVLVVDDSALMRQFMCELLSGDADLQLATAQDGREALKQLHAFQPDVITLDINMPDMDGLTALSHIMTERPTPVVVVSSLVGKSATVTLEALAMGAVDYIAKPGGTISASLDDVAVELRRKVRAACGARLGPIPAALPLSEALPVLSQRQRRAIEEDISEESAAFRAGIAASPQGRQRRAPARPAAARSAPDRPAPAKPAPARSAAPARAPRTERPTPDQGKATRVAAAGARSLARQAPTIPAEGGAASATPVAGAPPATAPDALRRPDFLPGYADPDGLVLVGVSTGGPRVLPEILRAIRPDLRWPIVICQHMPDNFTESFARRLDDLCPLPVREVREDMPVKPGHVYLARGGFDLSFLRREGRLWVQAEPERAKYLWHPSVEHMVRSAMQHLPARQLIGVMLTGMGYDGAEAMNELKKQGGRTVAESRESAVVYGMPKELIERGGASRIALAGDIPNVLHDWLGTTA